VKTPKKQPVDKSPRFIVISETGHHKIVDTCERIIICQVDTDYGKADADGTARNRASRLCSLLNQADFW